MSSGGRRLFIVGAGGLGRELESWLDREPAGSRDWRICGYLDDRPHALDGYRSDYRIVGPVASFDFRESDLAILAIADPKVKKNVVERLAGRVEFLTFLPSGTVVGKDVRIGRGVVVGLDCLFTTNVTVGDFATINCRTSLGHDVEVGAYSTLLGNVMVCGHCAVGESVVVGTSATIIPGRRVQDFAVVGAGAVVFRHVAAGTTVVGNPAKVFCEHSDAAA